MYLQGNSFRTIAIFLNNNGYPTKNSSRWFTKVIKNILQNEFYLGHLTQGRHKKIDVTIKKLEYVNKSKWHIHKNNHKAIVTEEIFYKVQTEIKKRAEYRKGDNPSRYSAKHLFSNLVKCKICGQSFIHRRRADKNKLSYYACTAYMSLGRASGHGSNRISEKRLIAVVKSGLETLADSDYKFVKDFYRRKTAEINKEAENISVSSINEQIEEQTRLSLSLLNAFTEGILGKNQFKLQNETIEEKLNSLMQQRELLLHNTDKTAVNANDEGETIKAIRKLLDMDISQWDNALMKKVIKKIYMDLPNNDIEINFDYDTSSK